MCFGKVTWLFAKAGWKVSRENCPQQWFGEVCLQCNLLLVTLKAGEGEDQRKWTEVLWDE